MRSRGDHGAVVHVRDLIEAGLNEPVGAATRYGICAAAPARCAHFWATRCRCAGRGDVEPLVLAVAIGAPGVMRNSAVG